MRDLLSRAGSSVWMVPLLFAAWRVASFLFAEKLPSDYPPVSDGFSYIGIARKFLESQQIDGYRVMRIAPSGVVHMALGALGLSHSNLNIIRGFEVLNLLALSTSAYAVDRILRRLDVAARTRELGVVLLLVNYPMLKYSVFYPVLTDFSAIGLASLLLLFYLEGRPAALVVTSIVGAFTWPILFYQGLILLVFPAEDREKERLSKGWRALLSAGSAAWGLGLLVYFVVIRGMDTYTGSIRLEPVYVIAAAVFLIPMYFYLPTMLFQRAFFDLRAIVASAPVGRAFAALLLFGAFWLLKDALVVREFAPERLYVSRFLSVQILYGSARPLINLIAHTSFYGCLAVLVIILWKPFGLAVARRGIGLVLAFLLNFYVVVLASESRQISNLLPWFVVFVCVVLDRYRLPRHFAPMILVLNVVLSKVWLPMGDPWLTQRHLMSNGPWMSDASWRLQLAGFVIVLALLWLSLFRVRLAGGLSVEYAPGVGPRDPATDTRRGRSIPLGLWIGVAAAAPLVFLGLRAL